ncbi:protein DMP2-like [Macadamia integrifolia]|uniref:protein DMP2-like n=1 Tax=Macadamia integrifolia TaxID=60698 RepID=UPI001C4E67AC|nr:protein DMP2-like [Macadamia integrifolia]
MENDKVTSPSSSSSAEKKKEKVGMVNKTLKGMSDLIQYLPTGTVFLFQTLNPIFTIAGHCTEINEILTGIFLAFCATSCVFSCFTDSYVGSDALIHYGIATFDGLWPAPNSDNIDISKYKITLGDVVDALCSLIVFAVIAILDPNTTNCFYPEFGVFQKVLVVILPAVVGFFASTVFNFFPKKRHGIGRIPACYS